jgi:hypothetical protein
VTALPPDPQVSIGCQGPTADGDYAHICIDVGDTASAGPITADTSVDIPAPAGMTPESAGGKGWNCQDRQSQDGFICITMGEANPGQELPPVDTTWKVDGGVTGTVPVTATATTAGEANPDGATATAQVRELPPAPKLTTSVASTGPVGASGTADLTVNVGDAAGAGPSDGSGTVTISLPDQLMPDSVYGDGWSCMPGVGSVACTRTDGDGLQPGQDYPPITVSSQASAAWDGTGITAVVG